MEEDDHHYFSFAELDLSAATSSCCTGYLEDALFCKRRRVKSHFYDYEWENSAQNFHVQVGEISSSTSAASTESGVDYSSSSSGGGVVFRSQDSSSRDENIVAAKSVSSDKHVDRYYSCSSAPTAAQQLLHQHYAWAGRGIEIKKEAKEHEAEEKQQKIVTPSTSGGGGGGGNRRIKRRRVAYPFALVKPGGGEEGVVTIEEINSRLLMTPTRPLRHPVGDYACRPCVSAAGRPGLSGKAVVALTKIYTQGGKGTVTIIRTKG